MQTNGSKRSSTTRSLSLPESSGAGLPSDAGVLVFQDPLNRKRYGVVDLKGGTSSTGTAKHVTAEIRETIGRLARDDLPTNIEWAALRTLAGTRPVIIPTRRGGAWLYIERLDQRIYEIRVIAPYSVDRGRAKLVTARELASVITRVRAKKAGPPNQQSPP